MQVYCSVQLCAPSGTMRGSGGSFAYSFLSVIPVIAKRSSGGRVSGKVPSGNAGAVDNSESQNGGGSRGKVGY